MSNGQRYKKLKMDWKHSIIIIKDQASLQEKKISFSMILDNDAQL